MPLDARRDLQYIRNMKTIAITIKPETLTALDRFRAANGKKSRSACVRDALESWLAAQRRRQEDARDDEIYRRHAGLLNRQARALIREQAKL